VLGALLPEHDPTGRDLLAIATDIADPAQTQRMVDAAIAGSDGLTC
jgi:hypothetical protein